jgi:hypothetical protein
MTITSKESGTVVTIEDKGFKSWYTCNFRSHGQVTQFSYSTKTYEPIWILLYCLNRDNRGSVSKMLDLDIYINLQKFLSSSYCSPQIYCPTEGAGTGCPDLQHCMHCAEEFALPALAICRMPFPALSCLDLITRHESFNHGHPSPYQLKESKTSIGHRMCSPT